MVEHDWFDTDIPPPAQKAGLRRGPELSNPLHFMPVGGSRLFTGRTHRSVANSVYVIGRRSGKKFTTAKEEGGIRVWRTE